MGTKHQIMNRLQARHAIFFYFYFYFITINDKVCQKCEIRRIPIDITLSRKPFSYDHWSLHLLKLSSLSAIVISRATLTSGVINDVVAKAMSQMVVSLYQLTLYGHLAYRWDSTCVKSIEMYSHLMTCLVYRLLCSSLNGKLYA